jgi:II/X family phage/plasmid replication protein
MYDTIKISSPGLDYDSIAHIAGKLINSNQVTEWLPPLGPDEDCLCGQLLNHHYVTASVKLHSMRLLRNVPTADDYIRAAGTGRHPRVSVWWEESAPYMTIEASVHKMMLGHNITGGPVNFQPAVAWFVDHISQILDIPLPPYFEWEVNRIDYAENYELNPDAIGDFIESAGRNKCKRRQVTAYGRESLHCQGKTTTIKAYHKGTELLRHDAGRLRANLPDSDFRRLLETANHTLRVESTIRARKLRTDLKLKHREILVSDILDEHIQAIHHDDVYRLFREGQYGTHPVLRHPVTVRERLCGMFSACLARNLYRTWTLLVEHGELATRAHMKSSTFYKHHAKLLEAGCSWHGANICAQSSSVPDGFSLCRSDPRRCTDEDPLVAEMLAPYRRNICNG